MILQKPLTSAPPRLQRMIIKLQGYQMQIEYILGQEMTLADTLRRLPSTGNTDTIDLDIRADLVRFRNERLNEIRKEIKADQVLDQMQGIVTAGWLDLIKDLPSVIRSYWPCRDELSVNNNIMKGPRIIIPETQQKIIWDQLHYSYQGVKNTSSNQMCCILGAN